MFREEVKYELREKVNEFLQNDEELEKIPIDNIKQVNKSLKNKYHTI